MAIDYKPMGWSTADYINPTNMNHMDDGIKAACDGVDAVNENLGYLSDVADYTKMPSRIIGGTSDMNTFTEYGRYGGSAFPSNMTNLPTEISALGANACNFELQVKNIGNQKCQVLMTNAYNANRNYIHVRGINGGSFGEWEYLVKNSDLAKIKAYRLALPYVSGYYCYSDITVPSGYIAVATVYSTDNTNIDNVINVQCIKQSDTIIRVKAISDNKFVSGDKVYVNIILVPDNFNV